MTVDTRRPDELTTSLVAWEEISRLLAGEVVDGLALSGDDPMVGLADHRPILLLETSDTMMLGDPVTSRRFELRVELLALCGFRRLTPEAGVPDPLDGWTLRRRGRRLELTDQHGNTWAVTITSVSQEWLAAAARGQVLVLYGTCLGVRAPRGVPDSQYGPPQRAAELRAGRHLGLVAAAAVTWAEA